MTNNAHQAPKPVGAYPFARKAGNLLFLSGVGPRVAGSDGNDSGVPGLSLDHNGNFVEFDFEAQVHSVFANVKAILDANGSSWEELLDITVFLVHMNRDFKTFNRIYAEYFPDPATQPCRTTIEINRLPTPIAIELKCVALYRILTRANRPRARVEKSAITGVLLTGIFRICLHGRTTRIWG